jgi:hypothetical protein
MASASAAERSQEDPALRKKRGQQVVHTFSGQVRGAEWLSSSARFGGKQHILLLWCYAVQHELVIEDILRLHVPLAHQETCLSVLLPVTDMLLLVPTAAVCPPRAWVTWSTGVSSSSSWPCLA